MSIGRRALVVCAVAVLAGCGSARNDARDDFVQQLRDEGGLTAAQAECVVSLFFSSRSDEELKAFFERPALTDAERDEFARLGERCADAS